MSDTGRDDDLIPDHTKQNYRTLVLTSEKSWHDLAAQFESDAAAAGDTPHGRGCQRLATWAAMEAAKEDSGKKRRNAQRPAKQGDPRAAPENQPVPVPVPARTAQAS